MIFINIHYFNDFQLTVYYFVFQFANFFLFFFFSFLQLFCQDLIDSLAMDWSVLDFVLKILK